MTFKFFSTKVKVSFLFMAVLCIILLFDSTGYAFPMLCAVLFHETGHFIAMHICGCAPKEINLIPGSVQITCAFAPIRQEIFILLCGPAFNLALFTLLFINCYIFSNYFLLEFALINMLYGLFNLIPVKGLDGGSVLYEIILKKSGIKKANTVILILTAFAIIALAALAVAMTLKGSTNYSAYIMVLYLILSVLLKF